MVSDWVKPIYKWSQIAFKKKNDFSDFGPSAKIGKIVF